MPARVSRRACLALAGAAFTLGCASMDLASFAGKEPELLPERFFAAELRGWGMELGPMGGVGRRLQVTATGTYDAATRTLSLDETYRFDDGHVDRLRWRITRLDGGRYEAREERLVEPGQGEAAGNVFRLGYRRDVPQRDGSATTLTFDDWFVRIDEDTVMVRASIQKLMVPIGSMIVLYRREAGTAAGA